ncbi:MAG: V-type ATPase subunit, partial [Atribacterota bacterium]
NLSLFFQYSFDFNDIKLIIKRHIAKKASGREYPGTFDWKKVSHFVSGETGEHLSDVYRRAIEETLAVYESTHHVQIVELVLDRVYLQEVMNMAEISDSPVIKNWLIAFFMFTFFRSAFRAKYQESKFELYRAIYFKNPYLSLEDLSDIITGPDEKIGEVLVHSGMKNILLGEGEYRNDPYYLAEIEKNMDNYLMRFIRPYRTLTFGPEPVFGFLYAKSIDIKNLRILLHGKYFGIGENELRNKLRECYYE